MKFKLPSVSRRSGFSLAEVTVATGITALALTTLLGLIPQGLNNIRQAGDLAAESRITAHIFGEVSQAKWQKNAAGTAASSSSAKGDDLTEDFNGRRYYFDDQGVAISDPKDITLAYVAQVKVPGLDVTLPSDIASDVEDPYLRRVTVNVASVANESFDFNTALPMAYRSHTTLIARTGK
ncbi:MAG TPA: Verru_Chthon cassette protein B [Prosthecobacter sp.]